MVFGTTGAHLLHAAAILAQACFGCASSFPSHPGTQLVFTPITMEARVPTPADKAAELAKSCGLERDFVDWLNNENILDVESVALMCAKEDLVHTCLTDPAKAANVESMKSIKGRVSVIKFWLACRKGYETDRLPVPPPTASDEPIPSDKVVTLKAAWASKRGFVLQDAIVLVDSIQGRLWRECNASPPMVSVWLAEALRTRSCVDKTVGHSLSIVPGKAAETMTVIADNVKQPIELYMRVRAYFMTLSYVSSSTPDWFPYQSALQASEQVLNHITSTYDGRTPPTNFLVQAWAATSHHVSEQARVTGRSPREILDNAGAWEHKWKWSPPAGGGGNTHQSSGGADNSRALQQQLDKMKEQVRIYQGQRDAALHKASQKERFQEPPAKRHRDDYQQDKHRDDHRGRHNDGRKGGGKGNSNKTELGRRK